jgi:hypothetical protein
VSQLKSFRDLKVNQKLKALHLDVHHESLGFPKFELYELGSQVRRSSNAAPAILSEGWGSRHTNIDIEAINRARGEIAVAYAASGEPAAWTAWDHAVALTLAADEEFVWTP